MRAAVLFAIGLAFAVAPAAADDLDDAQPQMNQMKAAVTVLQSNKSASTSQACLGLLADWKNTLAAIRYDMVHHDSDLPNARDILAMNYIDSARVCGADAARFCAVSPKGAGCPEFAATQSR